MSLTVYQRVAKLVIVLTSIAVFVTMGSALAQEEPADAGTDRVLAEGRVVYEANCSACHGDDGRGISGVFPPLLGNPAIDDSAYLFEVLAQGRSGELVVDGVTYDGVMPGFSALSQEQMDSLVTYLQDGLGVPVPSGPTAAPPPSSSSPGFPFATVLVLTAGFGVFAVGAVAVAGPVSAARKRRRSFTTVEVWLKVAVIVLYFVLATVFIPSLVVESSFLSGPPSAYRDLFSAEAWGLIRDGIGTTVWLAALVAGVWALRRAQRRGII